MDHKYSLLWFPEKLRLLPYAFLLSVVFALYGTTLYFNFEWDDHLYVEQNAWIRELSLPHFRAIWSSAYLGHYAPVDHTFLAILYHFYGLDPFGYHLAQVLLHAACLCLLYLVLEKLESPRIAFLAGLLFAVHPTNIETVAWVSEIKSTLAFLFFLLSFLAFLRLRSSEQWWYAIPCTVFLILSVLAKINTVVAPAIFLLYDYRQGIRFKWARIWSLACFFSITVIFAFIHLLSFFWSKGTLAKSTLGGSYYGGPWVHLANLPFMLFFYIRMVVFPYPLTAWHMFQVYDHFNWIVGVGWIVLLGMGWFLYRSDRDTQFWGLWFIVFLAPVLQVIPNLTWVAERYLYIPAIGAFVLLSRLFFLVWDRLQRVWLRWSWEFAMALALLIFSWRTENHLPVFRDDLTLWEATAITCPTSAMCHSGLGEAFLQDNQVERGVKELIRAVEIRPTYEYLFPLGDAYAFNLGDYRQAIIAYNMALQGGGPSSLREELYAKLARSYLLTGQLEEAGRAIQEGIKSNPNNPFLLVDGIFLEWKRGNWQEARISLHRVLPLADQSGIIRYIYSYWANAAEVSRLLSDLRAQPPETVVH